MIGSTRYTRLRAGSALAALLLSATALCAPARAADLYVIGSRLILTHESYGWVYLGYQSGGSGVAGALTIQSNGQLTSSDASLGVPTGLSTALISQTPGYSVPNWTISGTAQVPLNSAAQVTLANQGILQVGSAGTPGVITQAAGSSFTLAIGSATGAAVDPGVLETVSSINTEGAAASLIFNHTATDYTFGTDITVTPHKSTQVNLSALAGTTLFTGSVTGASNGTLSVSSGATLEFSDSAGGGVISGLAATIDGTLIFDYAGTVSTDLSLSGSGSVQTIGTGSLTLTTIPQMDITAQTGTLGFQVAGASATANYGLTLSGSAGFALSGGGTLVLSGDMALSGGTTVSAGTLQLGSADAAVDFSGGVALGEATTLRLMNLASGTFAGDISGAGLLGVDTQGAVTLTGSNTFTGGTIVRAGTLVVNTSDALPSGGAVNVEANAELEVNTAAVSIGNLSGGGSVTLTGPGSSLTVDVTGTSSFTGSITGGNLVVAGTGTLALTGASTLEAVTVSSGASLELGEGGSLGVGVTNDGTFIFDISGSTLYSRHITGTGLLTVIGDGTVTLDAANSFGSGVVVSNGTLIAGVTGALGTATPVTVDAGATLRLGAAASIGALSGAGTVDLAGYTLTAGLGNVASTFSGTLSGGTLSKAGNGALALQGASVAVSALSITAGSVSISGGTTFATGTVVDVGASGVLNLGQSTDIGTLTGAGAVATGGYVLKLTGPGGTFSGAITGTGSVLVAGSGTATFSGTNTYTGDTTVTAGTLLLSGGSAVSDSSAVSLSSGSTLQLGADETIASLSGAGTVVLSGNILTVGASGASTTFSGGISGGGLAKSGGGTLTLTGTADFSAGGLLISGGTVQIGQGATSGTLEGDIVNNGVLAITAPGAMTANTTVSGIISGSGSLTTGLGGSGTVVLTGENTFTGGTSVLSGVLSIGNGGAGGSIVGDVAISTDAALAFYTTASRSIDGVLSGGGSLEVVAGDFTLTAVNSYAGGTMISAGATLHVTQDANLGAVSGGVSWLTGGTFAADASFASARSFTLGTDAANVVQVASGATLTLSGNLAEGGQSTFTKAGSGTLILSGANSYSGGTQITGGTLSVSGDGNLGAASGGLAIDGATLAATASFTSARAVSLGASGGAISAAAGQTLTLSGAMSGTGALSLTGAGTVALTGTSAISGATTVSSGTLALFGGVLSTSSLTVASGATLTGYGTLSSDVTIASGATLSGGVTSADNPSRAALFTDDLTLVAGSSAILTLGTSANVGVAHVNGDLDAAATLTVAGEPVHGAGYYRAFTYSGTLTDALTLSTVPAGYVGAIDTANAGQVNVILTDESPFQIWTANGGGSLGGSGTWSDTSVTWYEPAAGVTIPWGREIGIFSGTSGTVTVSGEQRFEKLEFVTSGFTLAADTERANSGLAFEDGGILWVEGHDITATISAPISGTGGLTKIGAGQLILTGTNTYAGGTTISGGVLAVGADSALGAADGALTLQGGTLAATASFSSGRSVTLTTRGTFGVDGGQTLTWSGAVSGDGTLRKEGEGTLVLSAANTYGGGTDIMGGTLLVQGGSAIPDGSAVSVAEPARLVLDAGETIAGLSGRGRVELGSHTLTIAGESTSLFAGRITGSGALALSGGGTLVVTGENTYTGGTSIDGSHLMVGDGGTTGAIRGDVVNNGTLTFHRSNTVVFDGAVSGTGDVAQIGSGTLVLSGQNSYSGETLVALGGTLQVSANANLGSDDAELILQGGTLSVTASFASQRRVDISESGTIHVADGSTLTSRGAVNGGALTKTGGGTLILAGDNGYSGGTHIEAGRLQVGEGGDRGTLRGDVVNHGVLAFDLSSSLIFSGNVSGGGTLVQAGSGVVVLTGDVHLSGGTRIENGVLQVGNLGTSGSLSGAVVNDAILAFARTDSITFDGAISGTGTLLQAAGRLTLTGASSYSGGTYVGSGATVSVSREANLGAVESALTLLAGTLEVTGSFDSARSLALDGGGTIAVAEAHTFTLTGAVSGSGGFTKAGEGTLVLAADASYSGNTVISGGTLQVGTGGTSGSIGGDVSNSGTLRFQRSDTLTFGGDVSGSGRLVQAGTGTLILTGANSYGGGTLISAGTVVVGDGATSGSIIGDVRNDGALVFDRADFVAFVGAISGSGAVVQRGGGILQLSAANSFTGGITVETASTLSVASDANLGGAVSDVFLIGGTLLATSSFTSARDVVTATGTVSVAEGATLTLEGAITGEGGLTVAGPGTLILTAENPYLGGTTIRGAALSVGSDASLGVAGGGLAFNAGTLIATQGFTSSRNVSLGPSGGAFNIVTGETLTLSGTISGSGLLSKGGSGVLVLTGANSYAGGLFIAEGAVVGNSGSIVGNALNNGTLTFAQAATGLYSGSIGGSGTVTKTGAGTLIVTGLLAPEGGTTISEGTLQVGNGGLDGWVSGAIRNDAALVYDLSGSYTFPELLTGAGGVTLMGGGTALFAGSSYGGTVTLSGANMRLAEGASTSASVIVGANSVLSGTGTIGALTVGGGGTVSPGYSPGTLFVVGDVGFLGGSTYRAEVQADGSHDLIAATGAVSIAPGSTVAVVGSRGTYANAWTFNIITAGGGITGTFASATTNFAFLDALLSYGADYVDMTLVRNSVAFAYEARTPNERSTAIGTDTLPAGNPVYDAVASQLQGEAFAAFDTLSGEIYASAGTVMQQQSAYVRDAVGGRLRQWAWTQAAAPLAYGAGGPATAELAPGWTPVLWAQAFGGWGNAFSNGNAATVSSSIGGVMGGFDVVLGDAWRVGAYGGFSQSWFNVADRLSSGSMDNYDLGLYAGARYGAVSLQLGAGYGWHDVGTSRTVSFPGYLGTNSADYTAGLGQVFGEVGYEVATAGITLQPFAGLAYVHVDGGSGTEAGSTSALTFSSDTMDTLYTTLGLRAGASLMVAGRPLTSSFTLGWRHAFGDTTPETQMAYASGSAAFPIWGVPIASDAALLGASLGYAFAPQALLSVRYDGQIAAAASENAVSGQLQIRF